MNAFYEFQALSDPLRLVPGPSGVFSEVSSTFGTVRTLGNDGTGNVTQVSGDGSPLTTLRYRAFGAIRSGLSYSERGFAGLRREGGGGLIAMGARHYDTATGRFLQPDPLGVSADQLYAYAAHNPYRFRDPSGLTPQSILDLDPTGAFFVGLGTGALAGGAVGYLTAAAVAFCPACAPVIGLAAVSVAGYQLYQEYQNDFAGLEGFADAVGNVLSGNATSAESFQVGQVLGGFVGGAAGAGLGSSVAARTGTTRVGRWMSKEELEAMTATERVVEGAGGRTYVVRPPNPDAYTSARPGSVYAEFDVPTSALRPASSPDWAVIPGPNVTTQIYGPAPAEMPPAMCIVCVTERRR